MVRSQTYIKPIFKDKGNTEQQDLGQLFSTSSSSHFNKTNLKHYQDMLAKKIQQCADSQLPSEV